jgi:hypothetical protein
LKQVLALRIISVQNAITYTTIVAAETEATATTHGAATFLKFLEKVAKKVAHRT